MMNKMKSARVHLIRFLFVLPLIAILVLSFRNKMNGATSKNKGVFNLSGIVYDNKTELPLSNVIMTETATGIQTRTDDKGFYTMVIPITGKEKQGIKIRFSKNGYADNDRRMEVEPKANINWSGIGFFSLLPNIDSGERINHAFFYSAKDQQGNILTNPGYDFVKDKFENYFKRKEYDENSSELNIVTIEDVYIEAVRVINRDTIPVNDKGYLINVKDNKGNCTVVVKDKNQKQVKRILLIEWDKKKKYYTDLYGEIPLANEKKSSSESDNGVNLIFPKGLNDSIPANVLIILDGNKLPRGIDINKLIRPDSIESISVLKGRQATSSYGEDAIDGVLVITSKKAASGKALIILDGKALPGGEILENVISPDSIESITVLKSKEAEALYGDKAKNGVIIITSKKLSEGKGIFTSDSSVLKTNDKPLGILNVIADTISWSAVKKELFFKGQVVINDAVNNFEGRSNYATIGSSQSYVLLDGKEMLFDKDYINYSKTNYWVISLTKEEAIKRYGDKGKSGAIEIISQN